jgi:hypothetical protein
LSENKCAQRRKSEVGTQRSNTKDARTSVMHGVRN